MNEIEDKMIQKYKIAYEYYLFALYTFEKGSDFEVRFKKNVDKIKNKIIKYNFDFEFEDINEIIPINYKAFGLNIDAIIRERWDLVSSKEFNCLSHYTTGGAIPLRYYGNNWNMENRKIFLREYGNNYLSLRRSLLIHDILTYDYTL